VYLSENERFNDFSNPEALVWSKKGLVYGDWSGGSNGDGTHVHSIEFKTLEVSSVIVLSTVHLEFILSFIELCCQYLKHCSIDCRQMSMNMELW
jgi:hypothetical protein